MKTLISHIRQSSLSIFVVLFFVSAAIAQTTEPPPIDFKTPPSDDGSKLQISKDKDIDARRLDRMKKESLPAKEYCLTRR